MKETRLPLNQLSNGPWSHGAGERAGKRVGMKFREKQNSGSDQKFIPTKNYIDSAGRPVIKILSSVYIAGVTQHRKHNKPTTNRMIITASTTGKNELKASEINNKVYRVTRMKMNFCFSG